MSKGQTCIKYMRALLSWGRLEEEKLDGGSGGVMGKQKRLGSVLIFWTRPYTRLINNCLSHLKLKAWYIFTPTLSPLLLLQTRNNCDVTNWSPSSMHYQQGNVLHITRGREEITIFTPPISLSGANTLQNKSQCLSPNLVWQRVAACAILGSLWCQSPISPVTFFQRKSRFPRDSALCNFHSVFFHIEQGPSSLL